VSLLYEYGKHFGQLSEIKVKPALVTSIKQ